MTFSRPSALYGSLRSADRLPVGSGVGGGGGGGGGRLSDSSPPPYETVGRRSSTDGSLAYESYARSRPDSQSLDQVAGTRSYETNGRPQLDPPAFESSGRPRLDPPAYEHTGRPRLDPPAFDPTGRPRPLDPTAYESSAVKSNSLQVDHRMYQASGGGSGAAAGSAGWQEAPTASLETAAVQQARGGGGGGSGSSKLPSSDRARGAGALYSPFEPTITDPWSSGYASAADRTRASSASGLLGSVNRWPASSGLGGGIAGWRETAIDESLSKHQQLSESQDPNSLFRASQIREDNLKLQASYLRGSAAERELALKRETDIVNRSATSPSPDRQALPQSQPSQWDPAIYGSHQAKYGGESWLKPGSASVAERAAHYPERQVERRSLRPVDTRTVLDSNHYAELDQERLEALHYIEANYDRSSRLLEPPAINPISARLSEIERDRILLAQYAAAQSDRPSARYTGGGGGGGGVGAPLHPSEAEILLAEAKYREARLNAVLARDAALGSGGHDQRSAAALHLELLTRGKSYDSAAAYYGASALDHADLHGADGGAAAARQLLLERSRARRSGSSGRSRLSDYEYSLLLAAEERLGSRPEIGREDVHDYRNTSEAAFGNSGMSGPGGYPPTGGEYAGSRDRDRDRDQAFHEGPRAGKWLKTGKDSRKATRPSGPRPMIGGRRENIKARVGPQYPQAMVESRYNINKKKNLFSQKKNPMHASLALADDGMDAMGQQVQAMVKGKRPGPGPGPGPGPAGPGGKRHVLMDRDGVLEGTSFEDGLTKHLETRGWHERRFIMAQKWGFWLATERRASIPGDWIRWHSGDTVIHDASYHSVIEISGSQASVLNVLAQITDPSLPPCQPARKASSLHVSDVADPAVQARIYLMGGLEGDMMIHVPGAFPWRAIAPARFSWRPFKEGDGIEGGKKGGGGDSAARERQLWLWVHAAAFDEALEAVEAACSAQKAEAKRSNSNKKFKTLDATCSARKGELSRIELKGAGALDIIRRIVRPVEREFGGGAEDQMLKKEEGRGTTLALVDQETPSMVRLDHWMKMLPPGAMIGVEVRDPRQARAKPMRKWKGKDGDVFQDAALRKRKYEDDEGADDDDGDGGDDDEEEHGADGKAGDGEERGDDGKGGDDEEFGDDGKAGDGEEFGDDGKTGDGEGGGYGIGEVDGENEGGATFGNDGETHPLWNVHDVKPEDVLFDVEDLWWLPFNCSDDIVGISDSEDLWDPQRDSLGRILVGTPRPELWLSKKQLARQRRLNSGKEISGASQWKQKYNDNSQGGQSDGEEAAGVGKPSKANAAGKGGPAGNKGAVAGVKEESAGGGKPSNKLKASGRGDGGGNKGAVMVGKQVAAGGKPFKLKPYGRGSAAGNKGAMMVGAEENEDYVETCPVLLINCGGSGPGSRWSIVMPWKWAPAFWMALNSNMGSAVGFTEWRRIITETHRPAFPWDYADTPAFFRQTWKEYVAARDIYNHAQNRGLIPPIPLRFDRIVEGGDASAIDPTAAHREGSQEATYFVARSPTVLKNALAGLLERPMDVGGEPFAEGDRCLVCVGLTVTKKGQANDGAQVCAATLEDFQAYYQPGKWRALNSQFVYEKTYGYKSVVPIREVIGYVTTTRIRGTPSGVSMSICSAIALEKLREWQRKAAAEDVGVPEDEDAKLGHNEVLVLIRNSNSIAYRPAVVRECIFANRNINTTEW